MASPRALQHHERRLKHCMVRLASPFSAFCPCKDRPDTLRKFVLWPPLSIGPPNAGSHVSLLAQPEVGNYPTVKTLLQISTPAPPFYSRTSPSRPARLVAPSWCGVISLGVKAPCAQPHRGESQGWCVAGGHPYGPAETLPAAPTRATQPAQVLLPLCVLTGASHALHPSPGFGHKSESAAAWPLPSARLTRLRFLFFFFSSHPLQSQQSAKLLLADAVLLK